NKLKTFNKKKNNKINKFVLKYNNLSNAFTVPLLKQKNEKEETYNISQNAILCKKE
ncbi:hypothetical protein DOY81_006336, partial [Sarcophaga bullata]